MKELFKQCDMVAINPILEGDSIFEVKTYYNELNDIMLNQNFLKTLNPVSEDDLNLIRFNLTGIFRNRVEYLLSNALDILINNVIKMERMLNEEGYFSHHLNILNKNDIIRKMEEQAPYLFDLLSYLNENIPSYSSINMIAIHLTSIVYNHFIFILEGNPTDRYVGESYLTTNTLFIDLTQQIEKIILTLYNEASNIFLSTRVDKNVKRLESVTVEANNGIEFIR